MRYNIFMDESLNLKPNNPKEGVEKEGKEKIKRRILIADDEESTRRMLVDVLSFYGFEVVAVKNGQELLAELNSGHKYNLVITDQDMHKAGGTKTDGIDTLKQIREKLEFDRLSVILWSGALDDNTRKEVGELKNSRCFEKTGDIAIIKKNIEGMIGGPSIEKAEQ